MKAARFFIIGFVLSFAVISFSGPVIASDEGLPQNQAQDQEDLGTCFYSIDCLGNPIGLYETVKSCQLLGGHSLKVQNAACTNF